MDPDLAGSSRCRARCLQPLKVHAILKPSCHVVFQPLAVHDILQPSCYQLLAVYAILPPRRQPLAVVAIFFLLKGQRPSAIAAASRASAFFMEGEQQRRGKGCCGAGKSNFGWGLCWLLLCRSISSASSNDSSETCQYTIASR